MATKNLSREEARALRTIEAIYGSPEDVDDDPPFDEAARRRMRNAVEVAFAQADQRRLAIVRRPGLLELAGDALRERIAALQVALGQVQLAHRNLASMSDEDLRTLLADLEEYAAHKGIVS